MNLYFNRSKIALHNLLLNLIFLIMGIFYHQCKSKIVLSLCVNVGVHVCMHIRLEDNRRHHSSRTVHLSSFVLRQGLSLGLEPIY